MIKLNIAGLSSSFGALPEVKVLCFLERQRIRGGAVSAARKCGREAAREVVPD